MTFANLSLWFSVSSAYFSWTKFSNVCNYSSGKLPLISFSLIKALLFSTFSSVLKLQGLIFPLRVLPTSLAIIISIIILFNITTSNKISEKYHLEHILYFSKNKQHFRRKIYGSYRSRWHNHRCICFKQESPRLNIPGKSDQNNSYSPEYLHSRVPPPDGNQIGTSNTPSYQSSQGSRELVLTMISWQESAK